MEIFKRNPTMRRACWTLMWITLIATLVRQCTMAEETRRQIDSLEQRINMIEERPAVEIRLEKETDE